MNKIDFLTAVNNSQRCQRNWDLSKEVDDETIAWLMEIGYSTATKQNLDRYDLEIMLGVGYPLYDTHTLHTDNIHTSESLVKYTPRKLII